MFALNAVTLVLAALATTSQAGPLKKRIAQTIADSTAKWEQACLAAGGGQQCNPLSVSAMATLLAAAGPCDQQNAADQMINLAKTLQNNTQMIALTQIFVQQPRNSPDSFSIPYCQQAPSNSELNGLFQCQFDGTKSTFVGNLQPGATGTVPFGLTSLNTPKACPANPSGGIADGTQLNAITQDPGLNNIGKLGGSQNGGSSSPPSSVVSSDTSSSTDSATATPQAASCSASPPAPTTTPVSSSDGSSGGNNNPSSFQLQNGQDAQKLNAQFQALTPNSSCTTNENACINGQFALCTNGQFVLMQCAAGETCAALPLVNKPGTTVTCTTQSDALSRINATGATGGLTGSGSSS